MNLNELTEIRDLDRIKCILLDILSYIDDLCEKNNIRYSIAYGTLIGAIRHHGFIPWDDDIDIYMPREDFKRFISVINAQSSRYRLFSLETDPNYDSTIAKVVDTNTLLVQKKAGSQFDSNGNSKYNLGLYVDIFVLDFIPEEINKAKKVVRRATYLQKLWAFCFFAPNNKHGKITNLLRERINKTSFAAYYAKKTNQYACNLDVKKSKTIANLLNVGPNCLKDTFQIEEFDTCITVQFEKKNFRAISNYDKVLKSWYGDYMTLPPENERISNHLYNVYEI